MKSEHRHELKTNDLAEWLGNLPQWTRENYKVIIGLAILIIPLAGFFIWKTYNTNVVQLHEQEEFTNVLTGISEAKSGIVSSQMLGSDNSYILGRSADELENLAQVISNQNMAAFALIKQAEALRAELHYRRVAPTKDEQAEQLNKARASYDLAVQKSTSNVLTAVATFGIGLCEEELGNFDQARQIYQDIVANPEFAGIATVAAAELRLKTMSDYQTDIIFQPAPVEATVTTAQPQIQISPVDANLPAEVNWPTEINLPAEMNLPADINLPFEISVRPPIEINLPEEDGVEDSVIIVPNNVEVDVPVE